MLAVEPAEVEVDPVGPDVRLAGVRVCAAAVIPQLEVVVIMLA